MTDIAQKRADAMVEKLEEDDSLREGVDEDHTDLDCWREELIEEAFLEACSMITEASMVWDEEHGEGTAMHPMDAVHPDNVIHVYATSEPWRIPTFIVRLDELPAYAKGTITENREVWSRRRPGLSNEPTWVRIQIR